MRRITQLPAEKRLQEPDNSSDQGKLDNLWTRSELQPNIFWQFCTYGFFGCSLMGPIDVAGKRIKILQFLSLAKFRFVGFFFV